MNRARRAFSAGALALGVLLWSAASAYAKDALPPVGSAPAPGDSPADLDALPEPGEVLDVVPESAREVLDVVPESAREVLGRALDNRYKLDARASLEIVVTGRSGQRDVKRAEIASKWIDGEVFSIGRFSYPEDMRDLAMLRQGRTGAADEYFAWIPEFRRVRRMPDPPKADMFLGSDANFEDVERRKLEDYEVTLGEPLDHQGEPAWRVSARPLYESGYDRVDYIIARSDSAILEQRHYKKGSDEPFKVATAARSDIEARGGHAIPMRLELVDHEHGTKTELRVLELQVDPELDDRLFTVRSLAREADLPRMR